MCEEAFSTVILGDDHLATATELKIIGQKKKEHKTDTQNNRLRTVSDRLLGA